MTQVQMQTQIKIKFFARNGDTLFKTELFNKGNGQDFLNKVKELQSIVPGMLVENKKGDKFGNLIFEVSKDDKLATRAAALEGIFWHNNGALSEDIRQLSGGSEGAGVRLNDLVSSLRSINKKNIIDDFMGHSAFHREKPFDDKYHREKLPL
jgi:hypothetical protein